MRMVQNVMGLENGYGEDLGDRKSEFENVSETINNFDYEVVGNNYLWKMDELRSVKDPRS